MRLLNRIGRSPSLGRFLSILLPLALFSGAAVAGQTIGDLADNVTGTIGNITKLVTAASYVAGVGFALAGMVKFKAHRDNPTQVPLSAPIVLICVAAGLVFLPSIISSAGETVFGGSQTAGSATGTSAIN